MSIGIFGGSFDPPHTGHEAALKAFVKTRDFTKVFVVPVNISPNKKECSADGKNRIKMVSEAFSDVRNIEISPCEIERGGISYSIDTVKYFNHLYPNEHIYMYIGSDTLMTLELWHLASELMKSASFSVFSRTGDDMVGLHEKAESLNKKYGADITVYDEDSVAVSSTEIRASFALGAKSPFLSEKVCNYISSNNLYGNLDKREIENLLKSRVNEKRYIHCLGVAETAVHLAAKYGADINKAEIAGLLHDVTKNLSSDEQIAYCEKHNIPLDFAERNAPQIIHAKTAEHYLKYNLGMNDSDILSAVRYHTTGRAGMSLLEKIIYVSDFIEPNRTYSDVDYYRNLAEESIDKALFAGMKWIIADKLDSDGIIHPDSIKMYNEYTKGQKKW